MVAMQSLAKVLLLCALASAQTCERQQVVISWSADDEGKSFWPPLNYRNRIYNLNAERSVTAVDDANGASVWQVLDSNVLGGLAISFNNLVVPRTDSMLLLNLQTGSQVFEYQLPENSGTPSPFGAPLVTGGIIYFATTRGKVIALVGTTFQQLWVTDLSANNGVSASLSLWKDFVVAGTHSGNIILLNKVSGNIVSSFTTPGVPRHNPADPTVPGIETGIAIEGDVAFYAVNQRLNHLVALDLNKMKSKWTITQSSGFQSYTTPTVGNNVLYSTTVDGKLFAINPLDGSILWQYNAHKEIKVRGPLGFVNGAVTFTTSQGYILGVHTESHALAFSLKNARGGFQSTALVLDTDTIAVSNEYLIYLVEAQCL